MVKSSLIFDFFVNLKQFLVTPSTVKGGSISFGGCLQLFGFCTFEACVGIFWPSIMKMRSQYIPEEARSTIMNFFRIPLNIFVCIVLYNVSSNLFHTIAVVFYYPKWFHDLHPLMKEKWFNIFLTFYNVISLLAKFFFVVGECFPHDCDVRHVLNILVCSCISTKTADGGC